MRESESHGVLDDEARSECFCRFFRIHVRFLSMMKKKPKKKNDVTLMYGNRCAPNRSLSRSRSSSFACEDKIHRKNPSFISFLPPSDKPRPNTTAASLAPFFGKQKGVPPKKMKRTRDISLSLHGASSLLHRFFFFLQKSIDRIRSLVFASLRCKKKRHKKNVHESSLVCLERPRAQDDQVSDLTRGNLVFVR